MTAIILQSITKMIISLTTTQDLVFMIQRIFVYCAIAESTNEEIYLQRANIIRLHAPFIGTLHFYVN